MEIIYLGITPYQEAYKLMDNLHKKVASQQSHKGYLLVLQHPPTVTMGKRDLIQDMRIPPEELKFKGIDYHKIDRGGSVTVHEPGQIVIYPIINLEKYNLSVKVYVNILEEAMIETCAQFNVQAARDCINPGVWISQNKIGAVGIRVANKITKHGLAFNVCNTLNTFSFIVPCGLKERGVTNLLTEIKNTKAKFENISIKDIEKILAKKILDLVLK